MAYHDTLQLPAFEVPAKPTPMTDQEMLELIASLPEGYVPGTSEFRPREDYLTFTKLTNPEYYQQLTDSQALYEQAVVGGTVIRCATFEEEDV